MPQRLRRLPAFPLPGGLVLLVARSPPARALGLAGLAELPAHVALLLLRCRSVHTIGMRFALDLLWLGPATPDAPVATVVRTDHAVPPGRLRWCRASRAVIEARSGSADAFCAALTAARGGGPFATEPAAAGRSPPPAACNPSPHRGWQCSSVPHRGAPE